MRHCSDSVQLDVESEWRWRRESSVRPLLLVAMTFGSCSCVDRQTAPRQSASKTTTTTTTRRSAALVVAELPSAAVRAAGRKDLTWWLAVALFAKPAPLVQKTTTNIVLVQGCVWRCVGWCVLCVVCGLGRRVSVFSAHYDGELKAGVVALDARRLRILVISTSAVVWLLSVQRLVSVMSLVWVRTTE